MYLFSFWRIDLIGHRFVVDAEGETTHDMATHLFLEHTNHDKAYVCMECKNVDVVTQCFQRHLLSKHSRSLTDVERNDQLVMVVRPVDHQSSRNGTTDTAST